MMKRWTRVINLYIIVVIRPIFFILFPSLVLAKDFYERLLCAEELFFVTGSPLSRQRPRSIDQYSYHKSKSTWYTDQEKREMKKKAAEMVRLLSYDSIAVSQRNNLSVHGLSSINELLQRRRIRNEARTSVLMEQGLSHLHNSSNVYQLTDVYMRYTRTSQWHAVQRAYSHAQAVKRQ